jgi:hypothetical protein
MPRNDDAEDSLSGYLSSDDRGVRSDSSNEEDEGETEDEIEDNVNQETVGTFDSVDFLTPGGLSSFTVALPLKSDKLVLKTIKASATSKKSFRVTMEVLNSGIVSLWKTAVSENNNARSIHDTAKGALRRGGKTLTS